MAKVLTDGETSIGAYIFPDIKKPCLCIEKDAEIVVYGRFNSINSADKFMSKLAEFLKVQEEGVDNA